MQPTPLTPAAREDALRLSIFEGALASVFISITANGLVTGLALYLGAGPFVLGVMGALPFITQVMQLMGAYLEEKTGNRRMLSVWSESLSRFVWVPIAVLPLLQRPSTLSLTIFVVLQVITAAFFGIAVNTWSSWMTDLVPAERRGRYFGIRNTVASFASMVAGLGSGYALDYFKRTANEGVAYSVTLGVGLVFAVGGIMVLRLQAEPPMQRRPSVPLREMFLSPLADLKYRSLIISGTIWAFVVGVAGPFFNAYGIESLKMSFADLAYLGIVTSIASMIVFPFVGRMQDRFGDRIVMLVSAACVIPLPLGWILSSPGHLWPLFGTSLGAGLFWPGINQGLANMSMAQSPAHARGAFLATYGAVTGIGVVLSGLAGGVIAQLLRGSEFHVLGYMMNHYSVLFVGSVFLRAAAVIFVLRKV